MRHSVRSAGLRQQVLIEGLWRVEAAVEILGPAQRDTDHDSGVRGGVDIDHYDLRCCAHMEPKTQRIRLSIAVAFF